jgi:hypothetical protein
MRFRRNKPVPDLELIPAIEAYSDCPCARHHQAVMNALAGTDELFFCSPPADQMSVETSTINGETVLYSYATLAVAEADRGDNAVIGIPLPQVLDIILGHPDVAGFLVTNDETGDAFGVVIGDDIAALRSGLSPS